MSDGNKTSCVDREGGSRMVDIGHKADTDRSATASARVRVSARLFALLKANALEKGDALAVARLAGIQAAKRTDELIPLCHTLPLTHVSVTLTLVKNPPAVHIVSEARSRYKTGVEMEALVAAAVAALTLYDMSKSVDPGVVIERLRLERKRGGKSGTWTRKK